MTRSQAGALLIGSGLTVGAIALATAGDLGCRDSGLSGDAWGVAAVATGFLLAAGLIAFLHVRLLAAVAVGAAVGVVASGGLFAWGFVLWVGNCTS